MALLVQSIEDPLTLISTVLAEPGFSSIWLISELAKKLLPLMLNMAIPALLSVVTLKTAEPWVEEGKVTLLFAASLARSAVAVCRLLVMVEEFSVGSLIKLPPLFMLMTRPFCDPPKRILPAFTCRGFPATMSPTITTVSSDRATPPMFDAKLAEAVLTKLPPT